MKKICTKMILTTLMLSLLSCLSFASEQSVPATQSSQKTHSLFILCAATAIPVCTLASRYLVKHCMKSFNEKFDCKNRIRDAKIAQKLKDTINEPKFVAYGQKEQQEIREEILKKELSEGDKTALIGFLDNLPRDEILPDDAANVAVEQWQQRVARYETFRINFNGHCDTIIARSKPGQKTKIATDSLAILGGGIATIALYKIPANLLLFTGGIAATTLLCKRA